MRAERIAERIREDLSELLLQDVSDPRLGGVFVTDVQVDRELAYANIYVSAIEGSSRWAEIRAGLDRAQGFLRSNLAKTIDLRTFPRLRFYWDPTFERAEHMEELFRSLQDEPQNPDSPATAAADPASEDRDEESDG
jgi:ribosome-binding factor A